MHARTSAALAIANRVASELENWRQRARHQMRDPEIPLAERWLIFQAQPPGLLGEGEGELHLAALEVPAPGDPSVTLGLSWLCDPGQRLDLLSVPVLVENLGHVWDNVDVDELRREILELGLSHWRHVP